MKMFWAPERESAMPVFRQKGRAGDLAEVKYRLADRLLQEFLGEGEGLGPVIFEIPTPGGIDAIVVWEAWAGIPPADRSALIRGIAAAQDNWKRLDEDERSEIVRDAYQKLDRLLEKSIHIIDPSKAPIGPVLSPVQIAIGATWDDVLELNLLPYEIEIPEELREPHAGHRLREVGAIETPEGTLRLMYPTRELAREAMEQLAAFYPDVDWTMEDRSDESA